MQRTSLVLRVLVTESDEDDSSDEELILLVLVQPWELQRCRCDITKMSLGAYRPKKLPRLRGEEHRRCYECLKPSSELPLVAGTFYLHLMSLATSCSASGRGTSPSLPQGYVPQGNERSSMIEQHFSTVA